MLVSHAIRWPALSGKWLQWPGLRAICERFVETMKPSHVLMLIEDDLLARFISEGIARLSSQTATVKISNTRDGMRRIQKSGVVGLIFAGTFTPEEIDAVRDFQTALPNAPLLLLAANVTSCAPLVSGSPLVQALPLPIPDRDLQPALVNLLYPHGIHLDSRMEAYLSGLLLADIVQLIYSTGISAHLVVSSSAGGDLGDIEIRNGSIVAARYGAVTGARGVLAMLKISGGQVVQHPPRPNVEQNVFMPTDRLLIQAASIMDEDADEQADIAHPQFQQQEISLTALEDTFRDTPKLLVVEDNEFLLSYLERILSEAFPGVAVIGVPKGVDGLACATAGPPHAVILDRHLGDMKGEEFCRRLWQTPEAAGTPVLLMSGDLPSEKERSADYAGPVFFLEKPFLAATLIEALADMLGVPVDAPHGAEPIPVLPAAPA